MNRSLENWAYIGGGEDTSNCDNPGGVWFSLSFSGRASPGTTPVLRFLVDLGRDSRVARFVDDFVFFGFSRSLSFVFDCFSVSLPVRDFKDMALLVFWGEDLASLSFMNWPPSSVDFLGQENA